MSIGFLFCCLLLEKQQKISDVSPVRIRICPDFAVPSGLNVGDTLTFSLSDEQLSLGYYPGETTPEAANNTDVVTKTYTIVGIYNRTIF